MSLHSPKHNPLNVIALISGGKDSFFSLLHCLSLGHDVVALANLAPSDTEDFNSDLNSHMYQTAGHDLVHLYHRALSIPLYRGTIQGTTIDYEREYSVREGSNGGPADETEDLIPLLRKVLLAHPTANALSSGAILSTYQRTRVESVCQRLGLTSLAFLWQYPHLPCPQPSPSSELNDIAAVGLDARIIKVASGGLDESFLWQSLADEKVRRRLEKAVGRFGGSVLGEGGEYETIVVDGPRPLWKGPLRIDDRDIHVRRGEGGEAHLGFEQSLQDPKFQLLQEVEDGEPAVKDASAWLQKLNKPCLWDKKFEESPRCFPQTMTASQGYEVQNSASWHVKRHITSKGSSIVISNLTFPGAEKDAEVQMKHIRSTLEGILRRFGCGPDDLVFTTIILRSMSDFARINYAYGQWFTRPCPPARVTVACGDMMPQNASVMLSVIVYKGRREQRRGLHVQSRSYWAPANIGPYSQAISINHGKENDRLIIYIAGQIPLVPATMEFLDREAGESTLDAFSKQALLSLQHLWRIGVEMGVAWWPGAVAFIASSKDAQQKASICHSLWETLTTKKQEDCGPTTGCSSDAEEEFDIWDRTYGKERNYAVADDSRSPLPDFANMVRSDVPGFLAAEVAELPRGSQVEWQSAGLAGEGLTSIRSHPHQEGAGTTTLAYQEGVTGQVNTWCSGDSRSNMTFAELPVLPGDLSIPSLLGANELSALAVFAGTVYTAQPELFEHYPVQVVPCRRVWGLGGRELAAGLVAWTL